MNTMKKTTGVVNLINLQTDPRPSRQPIFGDHVLSRHVAIVYDVDGLRDSVKNNVTGLVVEPSPNHLSAAIVNYLQDNELKMKLSKNALEDSRRFGWGKSATESLRILERTG